jgi:hypothetical protein
MLTLNWVTCGNNNWCPLETVNLSGVTVSGVYIIWHEGAPGKVVYVGQGAISARLPIKLTTDTAITESEILSTWSGVINLFSLT